MIKFLIALWGSKLLNFIYKFKNNKQDELLEIFIDKVCDGFLDRIKKPEIVICITGTSGKTTVSNLITTVLIKDGKKVISNKETNTRNSIIKCLLDGVTIFNTRKKTDIAVLEVDEITSNNTLPYLNPDYLIITNIFRDKMDKKAHPFFVFDKINNSIPEKTTLILNSDDPMSSRLKEETNKCIFYSIDKQDFEKEFNENIINDFQICPDCNNLLKYDFKRYNHIGRVSCSKCGFKSKTPEYIGAKIDFTKYEMKVNYNDNSTTYKLSSNSIFNAYNTLCAITTLNQIGMAEDRIKKYLEIIKTSNYTTNIFKGIEVSTTAIKGTSNIEINYIGNLKGNLEIIMVLDNTFDNKNGSEATCWIYDTDFESLNKDNIKKIIIGGIRNKDYKLRLLLAGIEENKIICVDNEEDTYKSLTLKNIDKIIILHEKNYSTGAKRLKENIKNMIMNDEVIK